MINSKQDRITFRCLITIIILFFVSVVLYLGLSPENLINIGIMKQSLTSTIPLVKTIAFYEVLFFRIFLCVFGVIIAFLTCFWEKIEDIAFVKMITNYQLISRKQIEIFNKSFVVMSCFIVIGILYIKFGVYVFSQKQFNFINKEDGVLEYLTVFFLLISCIYSIILVYRFDGVTNRRKFHIFLAFVFFIMIGEEMSWGQRIFAIETPELLKTINVQKELNLHNLFGYAADHIFMIVIFIYSVVMPIMAVKSTMCDKLFDYLGISIASLGLSIGFLGALLFQNFIFSLFVEIPTNFRIEELRELLISVALMLLMFESLFFCPKKQKNYCKEIYLQSLNPL